VPYLAQGWTHTYGRRVVVYVGDELYADLHAARAGRPLSELVRQILYAWFFRKQDRDVIWNTKTGEEIRVVDAK
jgi:hypothetical protein